MDGNITCQYAYDAFSKSMKAQILQVYALKMVNVILAILMVGIGAYGHRYRHRPITRFFYDGATFLFLPIMAYLISAFGYHYVTGFDDFQKPTLVAVCDGSSYMLLVITSAGFIQIVAINTSAMVAGDDREGRNIGLPVTLLVQSIWTSYLAVYINGLDPAEQYKFKLHYLSDGFQNQFLYGYALRFAPFTIIVAKMILKLSAFYKVRRSYAFGRNPRIVVGYMTEPHDTSHHSEDAPPPLLVMGEETIPVEKQPHAHRFIRMSEDGGTTEMGMKRLVTIDKVWQLNGMLFGSTTTGLKDVCLSFSLFKLLRCRFAKYTITQAGFHKVFNFFWHVLKDGNDERVFRIITDELSFLDDYYHSSLPMSYPNRWLLIMSILISLLNLLLMAAAFAQLVSELAYYSFRQVQFANYFSPQVQCSAKCNGKSFDPAGFGSYNFAVVELVLLAALVVLTEAKSIASYVCSNWTKVALICLYLNHASWQQSRTMQKCVGLVLRRRCKLLKHWDDKMNQCSILVLHPKKSPLALLRRLVPLPNQKNIEVPRAVKVAIFDAIRSYEGSRSNRVASFRRSFHVGDNLNWPFNGEGTADTMLVYHIATSILDVSSRQPPSDHKIAATRLSRYCAYLVAYCPELLPDDDAWCKSLYKAVRKDAERILAGSIGVSTPEAEYEQLVEMLSAGSKHVVLEKGVELGKQLAELIEEEEIAWKALAGFWSEMILYVAPSENLDGHAEAIARGGELITFVWALLAHVGIVSRADDTTGATATSSGVV